MWLFLHLIVLVAVTIEAKKIQLSLGSIDVNVNTVTKSSNQDSKSSQVTTGLLVATVVDGIRPGSARSSIEAALHGCGGSLEGFLPPLRHFLFMFPKSVYKLFYFLTLRVQFIFLLPFVLLFFLLLAHKIYLFE